MCDIERLCFLKDLIDEFLTRCRPVVIEALAETTNQFAWLYFCVWYACVAIAVLNIVSAFVLEDFQLVRAFLEDERTLVPVWKVNAGHVDISVVLLLL